MKRFEKSTWPRMRPSGGMMMSLTRELTILPKAAPMTMPTARSMTLPRMANSRNSFHMAPSSRLGCAIVIQSQAVVKPSAQQQAVAEIALAAIVLRPNGENIEGGTGGRDHLSSLRPLALFREGAAGLRLEGHRLALGTDSALDAETRSDALDRRLSQDAGDADRRRYLLRHALHPPRDRPPLSQARPVRRRRRRAHRGLGRQHALCQCRRHRLRHLRRSLSARAQGGPAQIQRRHLRCRRSEEH